jgi:cyclic 2,3-diphosphoglycerate synthetase
VDGEHFPPVVRAAIEHLPSRVPGVLVVGAALIGGGEKLAGPDHPELGIPVVGAPTPDEALAAGLGAFDPDLVFDLSDEPVLDARSRLRLAARALAAGVAYAGADFRLEPPPRPRLATKPSVAVVATGKRTGKTAVCADLARVLAARGTPPVVVAMGRGGPPEPELIDPAVSDLSPAGLVALADRGRHAASDHLEDAVMARVATVGTRRCGGGLAGATADDTFAAGVELANARPESLVLFEGSGAAVPPAHADATVLVVPATVDPELALGYMGAYRVLLADLIVVSMAEQSFADSGAAVPAEGVDPAASIADLERGFRGLAPGVKVVHTVLRPFPLEPISGRRVFYVTTAPASAMNSMAGHLEREHGCKVVGTSCHLAHRPELTADLEGLDQADVLVVELKAAAVDLAARVALERGMEVTFCDNRVVSTGGEATFDELALATTDVAVGRFLTAAGGPGSGPATTGTADPTTP